MPDLKVGFSAELELLTSVEQTFQAEWGQILRQPCPFGPSEEKAKGKITNENYREQQEKFSRFALRCWKRTLSYDRLQPEIGLKKRFYYQAVEVGIGEGDSLQWAVEALRRGIQPLLYDVSPAAVRNGWETLHNLLMKAMKSGLTDKQETRNMVREGELFHLVNGSSELDFSRIKIFGLSRILQFHYLNSYLNSGPENPSRVSLLPQTLQGIGKNFFHREVDPNNTNQLLVITPFPQLNAKIKWKRTEPVPQEKLLSFTAAGAERNIRPLWSINHRYFKQIYTGMALAA